MSENGLKLYKIQNPNYQAIGLIGPKIKEFYEIQGSPPGMHYESLYTYFVQTAQFGDRTGSEFWIAFDNDEPAGFAHWRLKGMPYYGVVYCDAFYSWSKKPYVAEALAGHFREFGKRKKAIIYEADTVGQKTFKALKRVAQKVGLKIIPSGKINFIAVREGGK